MGAMKAMKTAMKSMKSTKSMKSMKAMKSMKVMKAMKVSKVAKGKRMRVSVFLGSKEKTYSGWTKACQTARKELGIKGFCAVGGSQLRARRFTPKQSQSIMRTEAALLPQFILQWQEWGAPAIIRTSD